MTGSTTLRPAGSHGAAAADLPSRWRTDPTERAAMAHDASHYLFTPRAVLRADDADDVAAAMALAAERNLPLTLRSGGTSLSGQGSGEGLLVDVRGAFRDIEVLEDGARVACGPGATVRAVNAALARHHRRLGPDPASEIAATIGGVVADNSSGMTCGTEFNAYRTVESLEVVLASGTRLDTAAPDADARLAALEPELYRGLAALREKVLGSGEARARIAAQYAMKNTMGYGLNSLVDFSRPIDVLAHLMVGSEGTLGFVARAVLRTVPVAPHAATALLVFSRPTDATDAIGPLTGAGARTLELMDAASLRVVGHTLPAGPLSQLRPERHTALLAEVQAGTPEELADVLAGMGGVLASLPLAVPASFTRDAAERSALWTGRRGLYTAVAGAREAGTTALLEDVAVPVDALTATMEGLTELFAAHGYPDAVTFGHARDGNLHFMITPRLGEASALVRYERFTADMVDLVLGQRGTLKAEHGTGRIMAPFVARQFGPELYAVMREIKRLFDPAGILNPGVILTDDPHAHLRSLKPAVAADPRVDPCVECGYCEPSCPSKDLTTTPRRRIVLLRTMAQAGRAERRELERDFAYQGVDTCAADSLCRLACPVGIDIGAVMKSLRAERHGGLVQGAGAWTARHWGLVVSGLRVGLGVAVHLPGGVLSSVTRVARRVLPTDWVPQVGADLPGPGPRRAAGGRGAAKGQVGERRSPSAGVATRRETVPGQVVYFPACIGSLFGPAGDGPGAGRAFEALCERAGVHLVVPEAITGLCCGTVWQSKGLTRGHRAMAERVADALWQASDGGALEVVCDASSCTLGLEHLAGQLTGAAAERYARLRIVDTVAFVRRMLESGGQDEAGGPGGEGGAGGSVGHTEWLAPPSADRRLGVVALHPTCSTVHLGTGEDLRALAAACAREVFVPDAWGCCAFAGDRGMLHPELTASATAAEAAEVAAAERDRGGPFDAYVSCNRTCEMGISRATGRTYVHVLELLERLTR